MDTQKCQANPPSGSSGIIMNWYNHSLPKKRRLSQKTQKFLRYSFFYDALRKSLPADKNSKVCFQLSFVLRAGRLLLT